MVVKAYIGLGSNLGDRAGNLLSAIRGLMDSGLEVSRLSRIYETEPVETFPQAHFLNMVCELNGDLPAPEELMSVLLKVEGKLGRTREIPGGPRTIDLDLLLYGNEVLDTPNLLLPHPRFHQRRFVLEPLAELAPTMVHPVLKQSIAELLGAQASQSHVEVWQPLQPDPQHES